MFIPNTIYSVTSLKYCVTLLVAIVREKNDNQPHTKQTTTNHPQHRPKLHRRSHLPPNTRIRKHLRTRLLQSNRKKLHNPLWGNSPNRLLSDLLRLLLPTRNPNIPKIIPLNCKNSLKNQQRKVSLININNVFFKQPSFYSRFYFSLHIPKSDILFF